MLALQDLASSVGVWSAAITAILGLLTFIARQVHRFGTWLHSINQVVNDELRHNSGTSMKDQLARIELRVDGAKTEVEHLQTVVDRHIRHSESQLDRLQSTVDDHISDLHLHAADPTAHLRPTDPDDGPAGPRP